MDWICDNCNKETNCFFETLYDAHMCGGCLDGEYISTLTYRDSEHYDGIDGQSVITQAIDMNEVARCIIIMGEF